MTRYFYVLVCVVLSMCEIARAQPNELAQRINTGIALIKLGCGAGLSNEQVKISGNASGSITLKKPPGVSIGGDVQYSKQEAQGLVAALQKEVNEGTIRLSERQLDCMKPYIDAIFKELFPGTAPRSEVRTDRQFSLTKVKLGTKIQEVAALAPNGDFVASGDNFYYVYPLTMSMGVDATFNFRAFHFFRDRQVVSKTELYLESNGRCNDEATSKILKWLISQLGAPTKGPIFIEAKNETRYAFAMGDKEITFFVRELSSANLCQTVIDYYKVS